MTVRSHVLKSGETEITVLNVGCAVMDWRVRGRPVALGYAKPDHYLQNPVSMGVVCGRVVNRIGQARFDLDGVTYHLPVNEPPHHVHGGPGGLGWRIWDMEPDGAHTVRFSLVSEDGDQGYPGRVAFEVVMRLEGAQLTWQMSAVPDRVTPVNLAQHLYFNLNGAGTVLDHSVQIAAQQHTPNGPDLVPLGHTAPVEGTAYDFRSQRVLADAPRDGLGWDCNLCLDAGDGVKAEVTAPDGLRLRLWTNRPGLQIYASNTLSQHLPAGQGAPHAQYGGLCLEAQDFPNALNVPAFGSILCGPDAPYSQATSVEIV